MRILKFLILLQLLCLTAFTFTKHKPVFYIIGDSTVKNGDVEITPIFCRAGEVL